MKKLVAWGPLIKQMIKLNPDKAAAFLARGNYWIAAKEEERGKEDIEQAYKLDPKNADVLLVMADQAKAEQPELSEEELRAVRELAEALRGSITGNPELIEAEFQQLVNLADQLELKLAENAGDAERAAVRSQAPKGQ